MDPDSVKPFEHGPLSLHSDSRLTARGGDQEPDCGPVRAGRWVRLAALLALPLAILSAGCAHSQFWRANDPYAVNTRCHLKPGLPPEEVVAHINRNISQLTAWRAMRARVSSRGPNGFPMSVGAVLAVEAPRNFRLKAHGPAGGTQVDFGSNMEQVWFWSQQNPRKHIYTVKHEQLDVAQHKLPVPFDPDWVMEVLGVLPIETEGLQYEEITLNPGDRQQARLTSYRSGPTGETLRKVTLIDTCHGLVLEHQLYSPDNQLMARAVLSGHALCPQAVSAPGAVAGIAMPQRIDLEWPATQTQLTIVLGPVEVNPTQPASAFAVPEYDGNQVVDLGQEPVIRTSPDSP